MKWYYYLFIAFVLVLSILAVYKAITPQNYNSNGISFEYPGTWIIATLNNSENNSNSNVVVAVGDPNSAQNTSVLAMVQKSEKSGTLEEIVNASKDELKKDWGAEMLSDNIITVDGRQAHDIIYKTDGKTNKKERMVIFDKDETVYCIVLGGTASVFDIQKKNFDLIVNSFTVTQ